MLINCYGNNCIYEYTLKGASKNKLIILDIVRK